MLQYFFQGSFNMRVCKTRKAPGWLTLVRPHSVEHRIWAHSLETCPREEAAEP